MKLTSFTDYSLRVLIYLGVKREKASISEISGAFNISKNHLMKAVHKLVQLGYVDSIRGKTGGIVLGQEPEAINLGEIIQRLEPDMHIVECFDRKNDSCVITQVCRLKHYFQEAEEAFLVTLGKYTLADLIQNRQSLIRLLI